MARTVQCIKLGQEAEGLDFPPYPGELGKRIYENVSKQAWADWIDSIPERDTGSTLKLPVHEAMSSPADPSDSDESAG